VPPPLVSVIVPTFNRWPIIGEAVASVLEQTFVDFELTIVDDGSTDETPSRLARYISRLRMISTERRGVAAARNLGVRHSTGQFIAFLDSDDLWLPRKLGYQVSFMVDQPAVEICQTEEIWIRNGVRVNPKAVHRKPCGEVFFRSLERCLVSPSAVMMTRALFDRIGGFDEELPVCEDYDLWLRIAVDHPIALLPDALVIKRGGHGDQLSRSVWGMDRYRVQALQKLLRNGLSGARREAALAVLRRKTAILAAGARKRGKLFEAAAYEAMNQEFYAERNDE
jgi:glycosyltransferase involved in cell wall biosynthesis